MHVLVGILVRHALTAAGAYLVAKGYADEAAAEALGGSAMTLFGFALSLLQKKRSGNI